MLECVLAELEPVCLVEQEFCVSFFALDHGISEQEDANVGRPQDRAINEEVRKMMGILFAVLEPELVSFLANFEKVDSLYAFKYVLRCRLS